MLTQQPYPPAQPSSRGEVLATVMRDVCVWWSVQRYSHDSTLGKGQVLHQDVETSILIIEELPDPPVTHENREGSVGLYIKHTPFSFRAAF